MAFTGDWITPSLCGRPYLIKPVLYHWLAAGAFRLLGENELAGRLPQAFAGIAGVAALGFLAARVLGRGGAILAGAALATAPGYVIASRVAGMDALLTACLTLSLASFFLGWREPGRRGAWWLACGFWAGLATLAKGPIGAGIPALVILIFLLLRRRPGRIFSRGALAGAGIGLATASVWYAPVWIRHGSEFTRVFWLRNNVARVLDVVHDHSGPVTYYLPVFLLAFLPWSLPFLAAAYASLRDRFRRAEGGPDDLGLFAWTWFLVPFLFFSLVPTKLPGYILPAFPAAAILVGREWERIRAGRAARGLRRKPGWTWALGAAALPGVALAVPILLHARYATPAPRGWLFAAVVLPAAAVAAVLALLGRMRSGGVWQVAAAAVFSWGFVQFAVVPADPYESMKGLTMRLLERREEGFPIALAGPHLKGTFFYTGCTVPMPRDLNDLPRPGPGLPLFCLVKDRYRSDLEAWAERGRFSLREMERSGPLALVRISR
jgi:4-amino-4-deoxy-L-arabinose transferase-like glycosyltransferase